MTPEQGQAGQRPPDGHQLGAVPAVDLDLVAPTAALAERVLVKFLDGAGVHLLFTEKCRHQIQ